MDKPKGIFEGPVRLPAVPRPLLDYLDRLYPDAMPDVVSTPEKVLAYREGQVSVVRHLKRLVQEATERELETT